MELAQRTERQRIDRITKPVSGNLQRDAGPGINRRLIFVSSTARDLAEYRERVTESIQGLDQAASQMEAWAASPNTPLDECMRRVKESDALVVIVAHCYGWVPPEQAGGSDKSITWLEVERGLELGKPVFAFLIDEGSQWKGLREQDRLADEREDPSEVQRAVLKLKEFKQFLRDKVIVKSFEEPGDLGGAVSAALSVWLLQEMAATRRQISSDKSHRPAAGSARPQVTGQPPALPQDYVVHPYTLLQKQFVGREPQLEVLSDWYRSRGSSAPPLLTVFAMGGMGKSALAWKWFREIAPNLDPRPAGMMWWSFQGPGANSSAWIERTLAYVTGLDLARVGQMSEIEQEQALFTSLDQNPFLIVMDGVERLFTAYHRGDDRISGHGDDALSHSLRRFVDPRMSRIVTQLTEARHSRVLITSRLQAADLEQAGNPIRGSQVFELRGLPDEEAVNLWLSLGALGSSDSLIPVFRSFGNFPLLIQALAATVRSDPRAEGDFDIWMRLHPGFSPFDLPLENAKGKVLAYALDGLSSDSGMVLGAVASFRGAVSFSDLNGLVVQAGHLLETDQALAERLIELEERGLIGRSQLSSLYDCHPVVRHVAWERLQKEDQLAIRSAQAEYLTLRQERQGPEVVEEGAGHDEDLVDALVALGRQDEATAVVTERIVPLAEATGNFRLLARVSDRLSDGSGEVSPAVPFYGAISHLLGGRINEAIARFAELHDALPDSKLVLAPFLSYSYASMGRLQDAERVVKHALAELQHATTSSLDPSERDPQLKMCLAAYAHVLALRGQLFQAERILESALSISGPVNYISPRREVALTALLSDRPDLARETARMARGESATRYDEIAAMIVEANCAVRLGDADAAQELMSEAVRDARETGWGYLDAAAEVALARAFGAAGEASEARRVLARVLQDEDRPLLGILRADAALALAEVEGRLGNHEASGAAAEQAYVTAWCDGPPFSYHNALTASSDILLRLEHDVPTLMPKASQADSSDASVTSVFESYIPRRVAYGRLERATVFRLLDQLQDALDESLKLYEDLRLAADEDLQKTSAQALFNAGTTYASQGDTMAAAQLFEKVANLVAEKHLPLVLAAQAALQAALMLDKPESRADELAAYDSILERFRSQPDADIRAIVTQAAVNRAITLGQLGRIDEAVAGYDKAVADIRESGGQGLRHEIYRALSSELDMLLNANRTALAESVCERLFGFLSEAEEDEELASNWVQAYLLKADMLLAGGRLSDAAETYEELHNRYGHDQDHELQSYVAKGLLTRSGLLNQLEKPDAAVGALRNLVDEYGDSADPDVQDTVALALLMRSRLLAGLDKHVQALADCEELDARFATFNRAGVRSTTALAFFERGAYLESVGRGADRLAHYDRVVERFGNDTEPDISVVVAAALLSKSDVLREEGPSEYAVNTYDEVLRRFGSSTEPVLRESVAIALNNKAIVLGQLGRSNDELSTYQEVLALFRNDGEPALREQVAMAMYNQGIVLDQLDRRREAVDAYHQLVSKFRGAQESELRERVAAALVNQGAALSDLEQHDEALDAYDELCEAFKDATEPAMRELVAMAMYNRAITLDELGRKKGAVDAYRGLVSTFREAQEPELRERVAAALINQGAALSDMGQFKDELRVYEELIELFQDATEPPLREQVAMAMYNRGVTLDQMGRQKEAIDAYQELISTFREAQEPDLRERVAAALVNKGAALSGLGQYREALSAYDELVELFEDSDEPALREQLAYGLNAAAWAAGQSGDPARKRSLYEQVVSSFVDDSSEQLQEQVSNALNGLAWSRVEQDGADRESLSRAVEEATRAAGLASNAETRANALDTAGWAHFLLGDLVAAEALVAEAAELNHDDEEIAGHLDKIRTQRHRG